MVSEHTSSLPHSVHVYNRSSVTVL